ncbi:restriction endonuclease, partial [Thioalkalivibrio sp. HK1]|uniref:restriction endonuclease n=1 Tax=Thioalkalivibrio sp. HK1 TaxID=1469245 RepID=UPI00057203B1
MPELAAYIDQIRRDTQGAPRARGTAFENLVRFYLQTDPLQKSRYSKVQTYAAWAFERGEEGQDIGVDLVATLADGKGYAAVQCKCYAPDKIIAKGDLDKFVSASSRKDFVLRIFVDTTIHEWGANAQKVASDLAPDFICLKTEQMEKSAIDWGRHIHRKEAVLKKPKRLRPHQEAALREVMEGFEQSPRGKLIMACGTGKTFTSLKIAEQFKFT